MAQEKTTEAIHLSARYTVKRLNIYKKPATTVDVTRKNAVIQSDNNGAADAIQCGDFVELQVDLPACVGISRRYIYCRCRVVEVKSNSEVSRIGLEIDTMQFRGEGTAGQLRQTVTKLVM